MLRGAALEPDQLALWPGDLACSLPSVSKSARLECSELEAPVHSISGSCPSTIIALTLVIDGSKAHRVLGAGASLNVQCPPPRLLPPSGGGVRPGGGVRAGSLVGTAWAHTGLLVPDAGLVLAELPVLEQAGPPRSSVRMHTTSQGPREAQACDSHLGYPAESSSPHMQFA